MEHPICFTGGVFEERVEYITRSFVQLNRVIDGVLRVCTQKSLCACAVPGRQHARKYC